MFSKSDILTRIVISLFIACSVIIDYVESGCEGHHPIRNNATLDYMKLERNLWTNISRGWNDEKEHLFELVRSEHKKFFDNFGEISYGYDDVLYKLPPTKSLKEVIGNVKMSHGHVDNILTSTGITLSSSFGTDDAKNWSAAIVREITRPGFWEDATNYLDLCKSSEYTYITIEAPYQKIYEYYHHSSAALLHTYISTQLSFMLKSIQSKEPEKPIYQPTESLLVMDQFKDRMKLIHQLASNALKNASREVSNCARNQYVSGCVECSRFEALANFLDGYIDNEINLNKDGTCRKSCSDYTITKHFGCADGTMCANPNPEKDANGLKKEDTICDGVIRDCRDIDTEGDILVNYVRFRRSGGRYNYIEFNEGNAKRTFGLNPKDVYGLNLTAPTWHSADGSKCSNCFCACDTHTNSDRHFSLHDVVSNIQRNKVVNGIRILNRNNVIQLQIWEGQLMKRAQSKYGDSVTSKYQFESYERAPIEGVDYFTMNYKNRSINLDDVVVPEGKVVTGVRFAHRNGHVLLEVRGTDFDYDEGLLKNLENSVWYSNENGGKHEIQLPNRLKPFEKYNIGKIYMPQKIAKDSFVRFVPSDFETDLSQIMLPAIETKWEGVRSDCQTALSGIGLTYVNDEERSNAGAIIPKLIVYEFPIPPINHILLD